MKKSLGSLFILLLIMPPFLQYTVAAQPSLKISPIGGFNPGARIQNSGDEDALNLYWEIKFQGGYANRINLSNSGMITRLPANDDLATAVQLRGGFFGFGPVFLTIAIHGENVKPVVLTTQGFLVFVYIFLICPLPM